MNKIILKISCVSHDHLRHLSHTGRVKMSTQGRITYLLFQVSKYLCILGCVRINPPFSIPVMILKYYNS